MSSRTASYCHVCHKASYPSREVAARRAARMSDTKEAYECPHDSSVWHFGESYAYGRSGP